MKEKPDNRQAERQALKGGHHRLVRPSGWAPSEQPPLLDEASTRYPKKKGRKKKVTKERCSCNPNAHTHEWMKDEEEIPIFEQSWVFEKYSPALADLIGKTWRHRERKRQIGTTTQLYRLCAWCGKTQIKRNGKWREPGWRDEYRYAYRAYNGRYRLGW